MVLGQIPSNDGGLPYLSRQATYATTGAFAGACTVPIEIAWQAFSSQKPQSTSSLARHISPPLIYRAGVRFWVFDLTKSQLNHFSIPIWIKGGLSGAAGGFAEICAQSLIRRRSPTVANLAGQSAKLFLCFGTYTYLSTTFSDNSPPKPFWYCWILGAGAGGFGSTMSARLEGVKGTALLKGPLPKGMTVVGTVIAVQVTSCANALQRIEDNPLK